MDVDFSRPYPATNVSACWSDWSPCTVTCVPTTANQEVNFARRWRVWLPRRCPNIKPPQQHTQFMRCSKSVPQCLELESIFKPTPRTLYRLIALFLLLLLSVVPSVIICCRYSSGFPVIRWERSDMNKSPRTSIMDDTIISDQLQKITAQMTTSPCNLEVMLADNKISD